ncbi:hypothetical protein BOBR111200_10840 [Bordetella bronchialis]
MDAPALSIGLVLYPRLTQLDLTGPAEVFCDRRGCVPGHAMRRHRDAGRGRLRPSG